MRGECLHEFLFVCYQKELKVRPQILHKGGPVRAAALFKVIVISYNVYRVSGYLKNEVAQLGCRMAAMCWPIELGSKKEKKTALRVVPSMGGRCGQSPAEPPGEEAPDTSPKRADGWARQDQV